MSFIDDRTNSFLIVEMLWIEISFKYFMRRNFVAQPEKDQKVLLPSTKIYIETHIFDNNWPNFSTNVSIASLPLSVDISIKNNLNFTYFNIQVVTCSVLRLEHLVTTFLSLDFLYLENGETSFHFNISLKCKIMFPAKSGHKFHHQGANQNYLLLAEKRKIVPKKW